MFEAPGAEPPQVVGNIETAIGCGTVTRGSGIAVQAMVGDAVLQDDVIETAADGRIGIRFIDGTAFKIPEGTRVVLGELLRGALHSALMAARGTSASTAGPAAQTGFPGIDAPAGGIRGRVHAGRFGLLSLLALIFPMLKEAQAADSNVTLLDDDNITYKDREHGSFELTTKEATPRHIMVEDPGETIVIRRVGSSVSISPVGNTAARMEELQVAQQDALANWDKGLGQSGSSAYPFLTPELLLQPINFIQTDDAPELQNALVPLGSSVVTVPDIFIGHTPTLAITSIAGQIGVSTSDIINSFNANTGVEIVGTTTGVQDGRIVTIIIVDNSNHVVYSTTATVANGTWSVNLSPAEAKSLADGMYTLTADVSNAAGEPADATRTIRVDETPPTIAIDTIVRHDVVNANAASTGFAIAGTTSDAETGQPVTVRIIDSSGHVVDTFTTTLTNNTWSVNVSPAEAKLLHDGNYTVTADVSDTAGNPAPEATQTITVDETPPTVKWLPQVESGVEGTAIALGVITATANSLPGHSNSVQSLVVSGIPVGAVLTDCTNSFTATSGNTSVDVESWNLSKLKIIPPNDTNFTLTVTATDQDANTASASEQVSVAPEAPCLHPVTAHGNEDTAIALNLGVAAKSLSGANGDVSPNSLDTLVVKDIPVGATLSDGTGLPGHSFTATADHTSYDVASWSLSCLKITPPAGFDGCFTLAITATERDSEGDISAAVTATEVVRVAPVAEPPTASAPTTATTTENAAIDIAGVVVGPRAEDADDRVIVLLTVEHGTLAVCPVAGVTETVNCPGSLTVSGSADDVNAALASLIYKPTSCFTGCDTLHVSVTSQDGSDTYPTQATAATVIKVNPDSEALIVGGPGPTLDWNDQANWNDGVVPTLGIHATIHAPCNYTVIITGTPEAQAKSLTIPHGAASTDVTAGGTLQLAGDLDVSYSGKFENDGTLEETANASFNGPIINNGTIMVDPNVDQHVTGSITGIGQFWIDSGATIEFGPGSKVAPCTTDSQIIHFEQGAGKLIIDDWQKFAGVITGTDIGTHLTSTDLIDLTQLPYVEGGMSVSVSYNSGTNISTMTFSDGISANNVTLHLSGNYTGANWSFTSLNGGAGTELSDPPASSSTVTVDSGAAGETAASAATINFGNPAGTDTSVAFDHSRSFGGQITDLTGDGTAATLAASQTFTTTSASGSGVHGLALSSLAQVMSGDTLGAPGDSFHFNDAVSGIKGSGITDVAEPGHTPASMDRLEGAAGTHGSLAISHGEETSDTLGDSFHFHDEISSFKGSGLLDAARLNQIPASIGNHVDNIATHLPPAISNGPQAIELAPPGQHPDDHLTIVPDHMPSALVAQVLHDLIV
ncbi:Ig-like domain-containing protein [Bradyrhizobium sp. Tv2a-2]|uniref:Ig-like domain-containing protein n=1 Tax=Bradyrhizobium sp. Tv2a-2 TaxID=113395 RepID=UPI000412684D|nr:Ig-like domain-containing protein [Bradyrhizobium sp. Tv2a-2]